jgi:hypothetical protein
MPTTPSKQRTCGGRIKGLEAVASMDVFVAHPRLCLPYAPLTPVARIWPVKPALAN